MKLENLEKFLLDRYEEKGCYYLMKEDTEISRGPVVVLMGLALGKEVVVNNNDYNNINGFDFGFYNIVLGKYTIRLNYGNIVIVDKEQDIFTSMPYDIIGQVSVSKNRIAIYGIYGNHVRFSC